MPDRVETETPVFTQEEVFMVAGFLAERWGVEGDHSAEIDEAIGTVLRRPRAWTSPVALEEWLPRGHPENPEHPQNRIGRLIDSLYAIRDSILNLDLKDALAGIDHALRMEAVEPAADHHYQTPEGWER